MTILRATPHYTIDQIDESTRAYHTRLPLLDRGFQVMGGLAGAEHAVKDDQVIELAPVLELALAVPGVQQAQVTMWCLAVTKSPAFEWPDLDAHLDHMMKGVVLALEVERILVEKEPDPTSFTWYGGIEVGSSEAENGEPR